MAPKRLWDTTVDENQPPREISREKFHLSQQQSTSALLRKREQIENPYPTAFNTNWYTAGIVKDFPQEKSNFILFLLHN